jgi:hypothetical protein
MPKKKAVKKGTKSPHNILRRLIQAEQTGIALGVAPTFEITLQNDPRSGSPLETHKTKSPAQALKLIKKSDFDYVSLKVYYPQWKIIRPKPTKGKPVKKK